MRAFIPSAAHGFRPLASTTGADQNDAMTRETVDVFSAFNKQSRLRFTVSIQIRCNGSGDLPAVSES